MSKREDEARSVHGSTLVHRLIGDGRVLTAGDDRDLAIQSKQPIEVFDLCHLPYARRYNALSQSATRLEKPDTRGILDGHHGL